MKETPSAIELRNEVLDWIERNQWKGFDPFDGLNAGWMRPFVTGGLKSVPGAKWGRLAILQAVKRSPVDLRPALGVQPQENGMSWATGALGAILATQRGEKKFGELAARAIDRMLDLANPETGLWGYPFPWQSRAFYLLPDEPNLVISSVCMRALDEGLRNLSPGDAKHDRWTQALEKAIRATLRMFYHSDSGFFSYVEKDQVLVHNANLFGAESAVRASFWVKDARMQEELRAACLKSVRTTLSHQEPTGRWAYGTEAHHQWADCFHSAYNLMSLSRIHESLMQLRMQLQGSLREDSPSESLEICFSVERAIELGLGFYLEKAFTPDGSARYFDNDTWPIEAHSAAAALICVFEMARKEWLEADTARDLLNRALSQLCRDLYLGSGRFAYRKWPRKRIDQVFTRWTQSWIYYGLESTLSLGRLKTN